MPAGRPSDYNEEKLELAKHYLEHYEDEYEHAIPSLAGLCTVVNANKTTVYRWAETQSDEFRNVLDKIQVTQEQVLITKGLKGEYNSNIVKLALGKHGYSEKADINHGGKVSIVASPEDEAL